LLSEAIVMGKVTQDGKFWKKDESQHLDKSCARFPRKHLALWEDQEGGGDV
jgi:hypothetical protein